MSKLSRKKVIRPEESRELPPGPLTSTQSLDFDGEHYVARPRRPPRDRDEELFQKQLEEAIRQSKEQKEEPEASKNIPPPLVLEEPQPGPSGLQNKRRKAATAASKCLIDQEVVDEEEEEFEPASKKAKSEKGKTELQNQTANDVDDTTIHQLTTVTVSSKQASKEAKPVPNDKDSSPSVASTKSDTAPSIEIGDFKDTTTLPTEPGRSRRKLIKKYVDSDDETGDDDSFDVGDVSDEEDEFMPVSKKKANSKKATAKGKMTANEKPVSEVTTKGKLKVETVSKEKPKPAANLNKNSNHDEVKQAQSGRSRRKLTSKKYGNDIDDSGDDDYEEDAFDAEEESDDEFAPSKSVKKTTKQTKKDENTKPSKPSPKAAPKPKAPATTRTPAAKAPVQSPASTTTSPKASLLSPMGPPRSVSQKWTPPTMIKKASPVTTSNLTPRLTGLRLGLSRNFKAKPLHSNVKWTP